MFAMFSAHVYPKNSKCKQIPSWCVCVEPILGSKEITFLHLFSFRQSKICSNYKGRNYQLATRLLKSSKYMHAYVCTHICA